MRKSDVRIGETYLVKVSGQVVPVQGVLRNKPDNIATSANPNHRPTPQSIFQKSWECY